MTNSQISTTEGSGKNIASYSISETTTKELQRNTLNNSSGTEIGTSANPVIVDPSTVTSPVSLATNTPVGNVAHDAVDSGAPIKVGSKAITDLSATTLVSSGDRTDNQSDLDGVMVTRPNATLSGLVSGTVSITTANSTAVIPAQSSGIKTYLTGCIIANTSSSTTTIVEILDGTLSKAIFPVPASGGVVYNFGSPIAGTAATAWNAKPANAATTIYVTLTGFKSKI